jgi:hypothetical protein
MIIALTILIVGLFILIYKTFEDLHDSVEMALRWNPNAEISPFARRVHKIMGTCK